MTNVPIGVCAVPLSSERRAWSLSVWAATVLGMALLAACGGSSPTAPPPGSLDDELVALARVKLDLSGDPATPRGAIQTPPEGDALVKLGQLLFFSQTLAARYDVSCATCHHPDFGAGDGLSISVGVSPIRAATVGPGREVDPARDLDPQADGGPNMHRNSITTFNAALFDRALMYDGRVFVLDEQTESGGHGQAIRTPESGLAHDGDAVSGLLEFTVKGPIVNDNEMRGFAYPAYPAPREYREHLVRRLRGEVDTDYNADANAAANWLGRFRAAFDAPDASAEELITMVNVQRALAAYVNGQVFVDTPWRAYLRGDAAALSEDAKQGARLFLTAKADGGLGCAACHSGDRFTDESFHNVGFPQLGRGFGRADDSDLGRWLSTNAEDDLQAFRTPSLLNVSTTAPYGHAGSFATLEEAVRYHADARGAVDGYDFTLQHLAQFRDSRVAYPNAEAHTRGAIARANFAAAEALLPDRALTGLEARRLVAFLEALTDRCVADGSCIGRWTPSVDEDPDGHLLVRDLPGSGPAGTVEPGEAGGYPERISLALPGAPPRATFADVEGCTDRLAAPDNTGLAEFTRRSDDVFGLTESHGYAVDTWFGPRQATAEIAMIGGGVSAAYVDGDCWADLIFTGGEVSGMRFYRNLGGMLFEPLDVLADQSEREFTGAAVVDLDGDYRRELILGNVKPGDVPIYSQDGAARYVRIAALPMARPTYGISAAPLDGTGYPYLYLAHWSGGGGTAGTSPALWKNDGADLFPWDVQAHTTSAFVDQRFNFTPKFADLTGDGRLDLVIASDFGTSAVLRNLGAGGDVVFVNETDREVITDQNGMGSALLDIDNDGRLEWFVTSVFDSSGMPSGNWGTSGNRLYRNASTSERIVFEDITEAAGVRDGYWGWGACAGDFDNDGFIDVFHVNGFGMIPQNVAVSEALVRVQAAYAELTGDLFQNKPARLFMNGGDGSFADRAPQWGIDAASEGRGVSCFDYDRDGDLDIVVFNHSSRPQFFENRSGSGPGRAFLGIRIVGAPPNTDAIGAVVRVTADIGGSHGAETQLRLGQANSNFNSQDPPNLHFGLGAAEIVDEVRVTWFGGAELSCTAVAVNQFLILDQRDGTAACP